MEGAWARCLRLWRVRRNGEMEIWLPALKGKLYLVAVDPAGGGSEGDYSAAQVVELETGLQCAEFAGHLGVQELARLVTELATEYNRAWLVIERNNHGSGVLALADAVYHYGRIFRQDGKAGWLTNSVTRPAVLGRLDAALVELPACFLSRKLWRSAGALFGCGTGVRGAGGDARRSFDGDGDCAGGAGGVDGDERPRD